MVAIFTDLFVVVVLLIFVVLAVTEVMIPTLRGGVLFPAFRKTLRVVHRDIDALTEAEEVIDLEEIAQKKMEEIEKRTKAADAAAANTIIDVEAFMKP
jgi:predicted Holliday junction resolvase-like endonuclease